MNQLVSYYKITFQGRLNRKAFLYHTLAWLILVVLTVGIFWLIVKSMIPEGQTRVSYQLYELSFFKGVLHVGGFIFYFIAVIWIVLLGLSIDVRRLHDLNRSGWWILVSNIPYVYTLLMLYLFLAEGTIGPNKYGADLVRRNESFATESGVDKDERFQR